MKKSILLVLLVVLTSGCAMVQSPVGSGGIFTSVTMPVTATGEEVKGSKVGKATCKNILGIVATGDCSILKASQNGGITKISTVDADGFSILTFFSSYTVIVTGE